MQLLKINSMPIKYELQIENAHLNYKTDFIPTANVKTDPSKLTIKTENTTVNIDTYESRKSLGIMNIGDLIKSHAQKSRSDLLKNIRSTVEEGEQMSRIEDGVTIGQIISQKMLEQPSTVTVFLPSTGAELSWNPASVQTSFKPGDVRYDWNKMNSSVSYTPGSVKLKIIEYPKVQIEYLGGPMYFPPSADPNYDKKETG